MNTTLTALIVFGCLVGAVLLGRASSSPPSRRSFDRGLEGHDQAGHGFGRDHGRPRLGVAGELSKGLLRHGTEAK